MVDAKEMIATIKAMDEKVKLCEELEKEVNRLKMELWTREQENASLRAELDKWRSSHN